MTENLRHLERLLLRPTVDRLEEAARLAEHWAGEQKARLGASREQAGQLAVELDRLVALAGQAARLYQQQIQWLLSRWGTYGRSGRFDPGPLQVEIDCRG